MTHPEFTVQERRRHPRVRVNGSAIVLSEDDCYGRYQIKDLSMGGMRLRGPRPMKIGENIVAVLELDTERDLIRVGGQVIRCHTALEDKHFIYIAFENNTKKSLHAIQEIVSTESNRAKKEPTVLVLDRSKSVQGTLKKEIMLLGHNVISTGTKKEAAWLLQDSGISIDVLFINPFHVHDEETNERFLRFLASDYPGLQVILFVDSDSPEPGDIDRFRPYAHAVLYPPWTSDAINRTVGL